MPKTFAACPTAIVEAPIAVVWNLLTNFEGWGDFYDVRVIRVEPPGPAVVGQQMVGESGPRWLHLGVSFEFTLIDEPHHKLEFNVPFHNALPKRGVVRRRVMLKHNLRKVAQSRAVNWKSTIRYMVA